MPFNGAGTFTSLGVPTFPAVTGEYILASYFNATMNDVFVGLTNCVTRDGQGGFAANVSFSGFRITSLGDAVNDTDAVNKAQAYTIALDAARSITFTGYASTIREFQTATASQTVFNLTNTYNVGSNSINVYINGVRQFNSAYTETSSTQITFASGLTAGDVVMFEIGVVTSGTSTAASAVSFSPITGVPGPTVQDAITQIKEGTAGSGGQVITGNTTLTNTSGAALTATPANPGLYVTLPVATTLNKATNNYSIYNAGQYPYGVKDSVGNKLGWIAPRSQAFLSLTDNVTTAGTWGLMGVDPVGVTGVLSASSVYSMSGLVAANSQSYHPQFALVLGTSARVVLTQVSGTIYASAHDLATGIIGAPTAVNAGVIAADRWAAVAIDATRFLVIYVLNSNTSQLVAQVVSVSGSSVTPAAVVNTAIATANSRITGLVAISGGYVVAYDRTTPNIAALRAFTVSGTTPGAMSAEVQVSTGEVSYGVNVSGTQGTAIAYKSTATAGLHAAPFTLSGTTITVGTIAINPTPVAPTQVIAWEGAYVSLPTANNCALITSAANVAAISNFTLTSAFNSERFFQYAISPTKMVLGTNSGGNVSILTNTAGIASVTQLTGAAADNILYASATRVVTAKQASASGTSNLINYHQFNVYDISGATAVFLNQYRIDHELTSTVDSSGSPLFAKAASYRFTFTTAAALLSGSASRHVNWFQGANFGVAVGGRLTYVWDGSPSLRSIPSLSYLWSSSYNDYVAELYGGAWINNGCMAADNVGYFVGEGNSIYCVESAA